MISLNGVETSYKNGNAIIPALKGITLNVAPGEIVGIMGRGDSGKSALIRCINLLEPPSKGSVIIDSCNLTLLTTEELRKARQRIGMIFQHFNLLNSRTVFENIALPLELKRESKRAVQDAVQAMLTLTGLTEKANAYPYQLNNLQKQRVAIARAMINRPKVLLCEEATASLDAASKRSIVQLLKDMNAQFDLTILLITQELDVIKSLCHRALVLNEGQLVEEGSLINLLASPKTRTTREFIKHAAYLDLPIGFRNRLSLHPIENSNAILHITFIHPCAQEDTLASLVKQYNVSINIIQAHLEHIQEQSLGSMIVEMIGTTNEIDKAIQFLDSIGLYSEVLGYVLRSA